MDTREFSEAPEVVSLLQSLRDAGVHSREYSDVVDGDDNQYVDLVLEGGGVLGIALVGYTYVLERMGLRFYGLAGTSAGAINAMMLAALGRVDKAKSGGVLEVLANKNLYDFVDGPGYVRKVIATAIAGDSFAKPWKWPALARSYLRLKKHLGLNPGQDFFDWLSDVLVDNGIRTTRELLDLRAALPASLARRDIVGTAPIEDPGAAELVLIAAELTTESRIQFPAMADLYWPAPDEVNPAHYVRASMSVPGFFYPVRIGLDRSRPGLADLWEERIRFRGDSLPAEALLVDGGVISNFPIDVFHIDGVPSRPTFGVRLGDDRDKAKQIDSVRSLLGAMFNSARHILDFEFILRHPDYSHLVRHIDVGEHNWLNFGLTDEAKIDLFVRGARAAHDFLTAFDWIEYKRQRANLSPGSAG